MTTKQLTKQKIVDAYKEFKEKSDALRAKGGKTYVAGLGRDVTKQELLDAYENLRDVTQLEENGFVVICPHCLNDDIEKMYFLETVVEIRKIIRVANGTICFGEQVDSDWTGEYALGCDVCQGEFALPTKAGTDYC